MRKLLLKGLLALGLVAALVAPSLSVVPATRVGNVAYTILATDTNIYTTTAFSTGRTWTLPQAASTCIGQTCQPSANQLTISDTAAAFSTASPLTLAPASGNTINGNAANLIVSGAGARVVLVPTSPTNWKAVVSGDYRSVAVAVSSAVSLTTTTAADITSISLSQGTWKCNAALSRNLAAGTSVTVLKSSLSTTTATSGSLDTGTMVQWSTAANIMAAPTTQVLELIVAPAATTTYFLVAQDTFTASTNAGFGQIWCSRL